MEKYAQNKVEDSSFKLANVGNRHIQPQLMLFICQKILFNFHFICKKRKTNFFFSSVFSIYYN